MRAVRPCLYATALIVLAASAAAAQQPIDQRMQSSAGGRVTIQNTAGSVRVTAWDRNEIHVTGTLGRGAERVEVTGGSDDARIRVVLPERARNVQGTDLEIRLPAGKSVEVQTVSADIEVSGVTGPVTGHSTSGDVVVRGTPRDVQAHSTSGDVRLDVRGAPRVSAQTTSGDVEVAGTVRETINVQSTSGDLMVTAPAQEVRAHTVSGDIDLRGVGSRVSVQTVSGDVEVMDSRIQYGNFEAVSGNLSYSGALARGVALTMESHSGNVVLNVPGDVAAEFEIDTFSGDIFSDFGGEPRRTSRFGPGSELDFTAGGGGGVVVLKSFSGNVRVNRR